MFQVRKFSNSACYCGQHPVRLPQDIFTGLQFVPLPLLNSSKDHCKKFSDLYGEIPSDKDRPPRTPVPSEKEKQVDKCRKSLLMRAPVPSEEEKQVDKGRKSLLLHTPSLQKRKSKWTKVGRHYSCVESKRLHSM